MLEYVSTTSGRFQTQTMFAGPRKTLKDGYAASPDMFYGA